ncbi:response regulator transcription factor [Lachnoclostridium sp. An181]|uniref:response regulator transcription factor n=1 Tax=Lachnoclostridium sp. An181 TaxID=1965575 RepID=UPI000B3675DD|nr:response regulator transcription factor [Lachnoclostridium sp. An181]OUP49102.1 DNA-binding response regulator [Lachnoclostridium sp. An181]
MIYCVEDDGNIRELIVYTLESTGFHAKGFENGNSFRQALEENLPELILLDIMLPNEDGMDILKELRANARTRQIPVIMVTAKSSEYDKVIGLDSGADDYITKPFGMMELVSRIKAVLRRANKKETDLDAMQIGNLVLDIQKHEVLVDGEQVVLTFKEFELLRYLLKNENVVLTRQQLLEKIWGYDFTGETRTVDVHIRTLRQKLGSAGKYIETVRGVGYRIGEKDES